MATMVAATGARASSSASAAPKAKTYDSDMPFGEVCLYCLAPVESGEIYCCAECKLADEAAADRPSYPVSDDYNSPVPQLISGGTGSSTCSSVDSSPEHGARDAADEPTQLSLPPALAVAKSHLNFTYRYTYPGQGDDGESPPFAPSSASKSSKASSTTPEAVPHRESAAKTGEPLTAIALQSRRGSMASPRLRPVVASSPRFRPLPGPTMTPPLRPLTMLSPPARPSEASASSSDWQLSHPGLAQAPVMQRRASAPLTSAIAATSLSSAAEDDSDAEDGDSASAFAHFLFDKTRRASDHVATQRAPGTAAPAPTPALRSASVGPPRRRYLFGRASPALPDGEVQPDGRGRSRQRVSDGSAAYRSPSPERAVSRSSSSVSRSRSPASSPEARYERGRERTRP